MPGKSRCFGRRSVEVQARPHSHPCPSQARKQQDVLISDTGRSSDNSLVRLTLQTLEFCRTSLLTLVDAVRRLHPRWRRQIDRAVLCRWMDQQGSRAHESGLHSSRTKAMHQATELGAWGLLRPCVLYSCPRGEYSYFVLQPPLVCRCRLLKHPPPGASNLIMQGLLPHPLAERGRGDVYVVDVC